MNKVCFFILTIIIAGSFSAPSISASQEYQYTPSNQMDGPKEILSGEDYTYNISYIHDAGSPLPLRYVRNLTIGDDFYFSSYSLPHIGFFNRNNYADLFIIKTCAEHNGYTFSFGVYIYLDFYERGLRRINTTNYDVLILGARNMTYDSVITEWIRTRHKGNEYIKAKGKGDYYLSRYGLKITDVNRDSYDDVIVLAYHANTLRDHLHRYASDYVYHIYYNIYSNGSLSIVYGKDFPSQTVIYCDLNISGEHPDITLTQVPQSINLYNLMVDDVNFDGKKDIVYIAKEVTDIYNDDQNITHIKGKINAYFILNLSGLSGRSDFTSEVDVKLTWQPESYYDYYVSFIEEPTKLFFVQLDNDILPDIVFYDYTTLPQIIGIYNFRFVSGEYNVSLLQNFSFSCPPPSDIWGTITFFNIFHWNNDDLDDFIAQEQAWITTNKRYDGDYTPPPTTFQYAALKSPKIEGPAMIMDVYVNSDIDSDGYMDAVFSVTSTTTHISHFFVVKSNSEPFNLAQTNTCDNISTFFINTILLGISEQHLWEYCEFVEATNINRNHESSRMMIFCNYGERILNVSTVETEIFNVTLHFLELLTPLNTPPQLTRMELPERIYRGRTSEMFLHVKDNYDNAYNMSVTVEYRLNNSDRWYPADWIFSQDPVNFTTIKIVIFLPYTVPVGYYDIRLRVYDSSGFAQKNYTYIPNAFEVLDNPPEVHSVSYEDKTSYRDNSRYQITFHVRDLEDDYNLIKGIAQYSIDGGPWSDDLLQIQRLMGAPDTFTVTLTLYKSIPAGSYSFRLAAIDKDNVSSPWFYLNDTLFVRNYQPFIDSLDIKPTRIYRGESSIISISGSDNEHDNSMLTCILQYSTTPTSNVWVNLPTSYNLSSDSWQATFSTDKNTNPDQYYFRAALLDPDGGNSTWFSPVKYLEVRNNPPVLNESIELYANTTSLYLNLKEHGWDYEDSDNLSWYVYSYPTIGGIIKTAELIDNYTLRILFNENVSGDVEVKLKAEDSDGEASSMSILIHVNTISPYVKIYGRITISGAPQGVTPEDFTIIVYDPEKDQTILSLTTDQNGRFEAYGVPRGRIFNIKILPPENLTYVEHVRSGFEPDEVKGIQFLEDFHLEREMRWKETYIPPTLYTITITVKDEEGEPVASARLRINETEVVNYTSSSGITTFSELTEGTYHLYIEAEGFYSTTITLNVPDQLNYTVTLKRVPPKTPHQPESRLPLYAGIAAAAVIIILMLLFLMKKKRGEEKEEEKTEEIKEEESLYSYEREEEVKPETPPEIPEEAAELSYKPPEEYS